MTREEWQRVKAITTDALAVPEDERESLVAARCTDAGLRREVQSLLGAALAAEHLFETSALTVECAQAVLAATDDPSDAFVGRRIGSYRVISELGRGGMGAAYLAERIDGVYHRRVAIKLIKRGMDTDAIVRRFLHERQILADLNHPNIAMLLDGGSTEDGRPYFIIEYVEGLPIDVFCNENGLPVEQRLQLVRAVCEAVDHAHQNRVIHRDLKPGNILVTRSGVPKLLDFGIATLLDPQDGTLAADNSLFAQAMTLRYASPEQIRGEPITAASDVYSLGVLLYELLTGSPPYPLEGIGRQEAERVVSEQIPPLPSAAIAARTGAAASRRRLAGDLDAIVMTALRKDPSRRYATAHALAEDLERHLTGQPVTARGERLAFRVRDYIGKRRRAAPWPAVALAVLAVAIAASVERYRAGRTDGPFDGAQGGPPLKSIAVLPLTSTEASADLEYLSDGLTENIIQRLSRLTQIRVIARDSVFSYKGKPIDALEVGRQLAVETILAGRIAQRDGSLIVSVELIDTRDRRQLWSHEYRRHADDVQILQAELSQQIADGLRLRLSPAERTQFARAGNLDTEAYHLYLKGRYSLNKRTVNDLRRSIDYFRQAVAKQPDFAAAHAGLADAYGLLTEYHGELPRDTYAEARAAAERALELDAALAEAHTSVAYVKQFYEWDWAGAEAELRRALALNPGSATAHQWYAELLSAMGRHDEALAEIRRATENDPVSLIVSSVEAHLLYLARRYDEAIEQCRKVIDLDPNFPEVYIYLKRSLDEKGLFEEAVEARQIRRRLVGLDSGRSDALLIAASTTDRRLYWQKRLEQELAESRSEGVLSFDMAEILAQAGNPAAALDWLEQACADGDFMTATMRVIPTLDPLRAEPRFLALLKRGCRVGGATSGQR